MKPSDQIQPAGMSSSFLCDSRRSQDLLLNQRITNMTSNLGTKPKLSLISNNHQKVLDFLYDRKVRGYLRAGTQTTSNTDK